MSNPDKHVISYGPIRVGISILGAIEGQAEAKAEAAQVVSQVNKVIDYDELLAKKTYDAKDAMISIFSLTQLVGQTNYMVQTLFTVAQKGLTFDDVVNILVDMINIYQSLRFSYDAIRILHDYLFAGQRIQEALVVIGGGRSGKAISKILGPANLW